MIFFIKNPNLIKQILAGGRGGWGVARESDILFFFQKNLSLKKKLLSF